MRQGTKGQRHVSKNEKICFVLHLCVLVLFLFVCLVLLEALLLPPGNLQTSYDRHMVDSLVCKFGEDAQWGRNL